VQNPVTVPYVRQMARRAIAGDSNGRIAAWLNAEDVRTQRGKKCQPETVGQVLRGNALAGYAMREKSRVRDPPEWHCSGIGRRS